MQDEEIQQEEQLKEQQPTEEQQRTEEPVKLTPPPLPTEETKVEEKNVDDKQLRQQIADLTARLNELESMRLSEQRNSEVANIIAPIKSEVLKNAYQRINYSTLTEEEYKEIRSHLVEEVKKITNEQKIKGAVFGRPLCGERQETKATDTETAEVLRRLNL